MRRSANASMIGSRRSKLRSPSTPSKSRQSTPIGHWSLPDARRRREEPVAIALDIPPAPDSSLEPRLTWRRNNGLRRRFPLGSQPGAVCRERPSPDGSRAREGAASTSAAVTASNRAKAAASLAVSLAAVQLCAGHVPVSDSQHKLLQILTPRFKRRDQRKAARCLVLR